MYTLVLKHHVKEMTYVYLCVCACVLACVRACVRVCAVLPADIRKLGDMINAVALDYCSPQKCLMLKRSVSVVC